MREHLFRLAVADDVPAIVAVVNAANSGAGGWTNEAHLFHGNRTDEAEVAQLLAVPGTTFVTVVVARAGAAFTASTLPAGIWFTV